METKEKDENIHYYYNREARVAKASPNARFALSLPGANRPNFFQSLVATRGLRIMFLTMVLFVLAVVLVGWLRGDVADSNLAGYTVTMSAKWFEGNVYLSVNRKPSFIKTVPKAFSIRATVGKETVEGTIPPDEKTFMLRLEADTKPEWAAAILYFEDKKLEMTTRIQ